MTNDKRRTTSSCILHMNIFIGCCVQTLSWIETEVHPSSSSRHDRRVTEPGLLGTLLPYSSILLRQTNIEAIQWRYPEGCMKVVLPPIVEKENDATVVDSFMTDIDSVSEVWGCRWPAGKSQKEWRTVSYGGYTEVKEHCMCMNQKCCGGYNKCEKNRATCTSNGFNCVQQTLDDVFSGVMATDVCDQRK